MSPRDDSLRLADMLAAAREARHFTAGRVESDLARDRQLTLALLKCVEIIGEAAARVADATRAEYPSLPWADMVGMRNRLVHNYFDVDLSLLWTTVTDDLPGLIQRLEAVVEPKGAP
jgi:uncharacterized protein with HEPN domain